MPVIKTSLPLDNLRTISLCSFAFLFEALSSKNKAQQTLVLVGETEQFQVHPEQKTERKQSNHISPLK